MPAGYVIRLSTDRKHYWTLRADNNAILLTSETYNSKEACKTGIESAKRNAPYDARYSRGTATNGQSYFTLKAENGQVLGTSETYNTTASRDAGIQATKKVGPTAPIVDLT